MNTIEEIKKIIQGDVLYDQATLEKYSHDASLFEVMPEIVIFPKNSDDVKALVKWVSSHKAGLPNISITARSAGTDMSGGAVNNSIILDFTRYMHNIIDVNSEDATVEPGCYYRDFEKQTLAINRLLPSYTASKEICAVGGMVANNSAGEKTIKYGKTENYVKQLKVVFADGEEYVIRPLSRQELDQKCALKNFEGELYRKISRLIFENSKDLKDAKPNVTKNSAGYYLWNVWDEKSQTFDLCKLIVGSQGTLGIITEITFKLVPVEPYSSLLAVFLPNTNELGNIVAEIIPFKPESIESYDDYSMKLAVKFFFDFFKQLGFVGAFKLGIQFLPELWMMITGGVPKLILLVECGGTDERTVRTQLEQVQQKIAHFGYKMRIARNRQEAEKYWKIRRESFNMLRKHVQGKRTAPFIDDIIVNPEHLPVFLPQLQKILSKYRLVYTIAGHAGNGNFHIIPLMDLDLPFSAETILEISEKVYTLVLKYGGSITAEHNDGIIRTPYLIQMFGAHIYQLFIDTKQIFDPLNIFNPGKKVGGSKEYIKEHIIKNHKA